MKRATFVLCLLCTPAAAQQEPTTVEIPTQTYVSLRQYLGAQPHDAVEPLIQALDGCVAVQVPQNGAIVDHGQCPPVTAAIHARAAALAAAVAAQKAADGKAQGAPPVAGVTVAPKPLVPMPMASATPKP